MEVLEIETHVPPLDFFTEERVAYTFSRLPTYRTSITQRTRCSGTALVMNIVKTDEIDLRCH
jgi:hypothetical protein